MDANTIKKVAHLARIQLSDTEVNEYTDSISNLLTLVNQLENIDTSDVEPLFHPLELTQRLRKDEVTEVDQRQLYQSIAPKTEAGLYLVPKVIEEAVEE